MKIISVSSQSLAVQRFAQGSVPFPEQLDLKNFEKKEQYTHASSAPFKVIDKTTGQAYILKKERGNTPGHLSNESDLENYARSAGVKVPASRIYKTPQGVYKLSQFIDGTLLKDLSGPALKEAVKRTQNSFLAHALLGNADMYGLFRDNVLVDKSGEPWFVDLGGGGPYRAMGAKKGPDRWNEQAGEVDSMRKGPYANPELTDLTDDALRGQFQSIDKAHQNALNAFQDPATRDMMNRRFQTLKKRFGQSQNSVMASNIEALLMVAAATMETPQVGSSPVAGRLDKYLGNADRWLLSDLDPQQQQQQYQMHSKSYTDSGHEPYPFDTYRRYAVGSTTPWEFLGDKDRTGYVTIKKVPRIPLDIYKLTATAGDKKGKFAGMAQILKSDKPIFGAVTDELFQMAVKVGFHPLQPDEVKALMKLNVVGGDISGMKVGPDGALTINHNVAGTVTKRMIANNAFKQLVQQIKGKGNFMGQYGLGKGNF